jgi:hypothetical protein
MEKEFISMWMGEYIEEVSKITKCMDKGLTNGRMEGNMLGRMKMIKKKG